MEDIACMRLHEKFPWLVSFCNNTMKNFSNGFVDDQNLLRILNDEVNITSIKGKKRLKELFGVFRDLFLHFWWKMRWKQAHTWRKYWKQDLPNTERNVTKVITKLLELLIYVGIKLSGSNIKSLWMMRIMQVVRILPDCDDILCASLLSLKVKKKYHPAYIAILKSVLIFNIPQYITEPVTFIKIMLLFNKLKTLIRDKKEQILLMTSAEKFQAPSCLISWISSYNLDGTKIKKNKVSQQLLKKSSRGLLRSLKLVIEGQETFSGTGRSMREDNSCASRCATMLEPVGGTHAFYYFSDYSSHLENQLQGDIQRDLRPQNKDVCEISINGVLSKSTALLCDETGSKKLQEVCNQKVIKDNKNGHCNDRDMSPSLIQSEYFENHVQCVENETNEKGIQTRSNTLLKRKKGMEWNNSHLGVNSFEKALESNDMNGTNYTKKRKVKEDKEASVILKTGDLHSLEYVSNASITGDLTQESFLTPSLNIFEDTTMSVSNYSEISRSKGDCSLGYSGNLNALEKMKSEKSEDEFDKNEECIASTEILNNNPASVKSKRYKLFNADVFDPYEFTKIHVKKEIMSDSASVDNLVIPTRTNTELCYSKNSTMHLAIEKNTQEGNIQEDIYTAPLFDSGSESNEGIFSSDILRKDSCGVEQLQNEMLRKEIFPLSDDESIQLLINSVVEKVSGNLDGDNFVGQIANNFNNCVDNMDYECPLNTIATSPKQSCEVGESHSNHELNQERGQWCAFLHQDTLTINCDLSDISSSNSQITINPIPFQVPLKIVINLNSQQNTITHSQCSGNSGSSSDSQIFSSNYHFHGPLLALSSKLPNHTQSQMCVSSQENAVFTKSEFKSSPFYSFSSPQKTCIQDSTSSPSTKHEHFDTCDKTLAISSVYSLTRDASHVSFNEGDTSSPLLGQCLTDPKKHQDQSTKTICNSPNSAEWPIHGATSTTVADSFSPTPLMLSDPQIHQDQSTKTICNSPNSAERPIHGATSTTVADSFSPTPLMLSDPQIHQDQSTKTICVENKTNEKRIPTRSKTILERKNGMEWNNSHLGVNSFEKALSNDMNGTKYTKKRKVKEDNASVMLKTGNLDSLGYVSNASINGDFTQESFLTPSLNIVEDAAMPVSNDSKISQSKEDCSLGYYGNLNTLENVNAEKSQVASSPENSMNAFECGEFERSEEYTSPIDGATSTAGTDSFSEQYGDSSDNHIHKPQQEMNNIEAYQYPRLRPRNSEFKPEYTVSTDEDISEDNKTERGRKVRNKNKSKERIKKKSKARIKKKSKERIKMKSKERIKKKSNSGEVPLIIGGYYFFGVNNPAVVKYCQVQWLIDNFEKTAKVTLLHFAMYDHYLKYCSDNELNPLNIKCFHKLVRTVFLGVQVKMKGKRKVREERKLYYYLRIKPNSTLNPKSENSSLLGRQVLIQLERLEGF